MDKDLTRLHETASWEWPQNAAETLLAALRNKGAAEPELLLATELAGDLVVMSDEMATALLELLERPDEFARVRAQAAIALGPALEEADTEGFADDVISDPPISEPVFRRVQQTMHRLYADGSVPMEVRRRILEASVRAPEDWHRDAIRAAYTSGDELWKLTAVFCMRFVRGFDKQIVEALETRSPALHYEAVVAAGNWEVDAAWRHLTALASSTRTDKALLLAAIEAIASIRPEGAADVLAPLMDSDDEEIADAASDALAMAEVTEDLADLEDVEDEE